MANHIHNLQAALKQANAKNEAVADVLELLRLHLHSAKFVGTDPSGERKDWIATGDVLRWLAAVDTARDAAS